MKKSFKIVIDAPDKYIDRVEAVLDDVFDRMPESIANVLVTRTAIKAPAKKAAPKPKGKKSGKS